MESVITPENTITLQSIAQPPESVVQNEASSIITPLTDSLNSADNQALIQEIGTPVNVEAINVVTDSQKEKAFQKRVALRSEALGYVFLDTAPSMHALMKSAENFGLEDGNKDLYLLGTHDEEIKKDVVPDIHKVVGDIHASQDETKRKEYTGELVQTLLDLDWKGELDGVLQSMSKRELETIASATQGNVVTAVVDLIDSERRFSTVLQTAKQAYSLHASVITYEAKQQTAGLPEEKQDQIVNSIKNKEKAKICGLAIADIVKNHPDKILEAIGTIGNLLIKKS